MVVDHHRLLVAVIPSLKRVDQLALEEVIAPDRVTLIKED
jgi:hypothetical protein